MKSHTEKQEQLQSVNQPIMNQYFFRIMIAQVFQTR